MTNDFGNRDYDQNYNRNTNRGNYNRDNRRWANSGSGPGFEDSYEQPGPEGNYGGGGYFRGQGRQGNFNVPTWRGYDAEFTGPSWQGYGNDYNQGNNTDFGYGRQGNFAYHNNFGGNPNMPNYQRAVHRRYGNFGSTPERKFYRDLNPNSGNQGNYGMNTGFQSQGSFGSNQNFGQGGNFSNRQDWWNDQGPYTGRGPKNFQRSDERICEDVCQRLEQDGDIDASNIEVNTNNGVVTLTGTVDSRQTKRMAEDAAESVWGVKDVQNQLQVQQSNTQMNQQSGNQTNLGGNQSMPGSTNRQNEAMTQ